MQNLSKEQVKTILQNAPAGSDHGKIVQGLVDRGYILEGFNDQPEPKKSNLVQEIAQDVVGTLVAKPAIRATEAITRIVAPESMATKGFEQMADKGESQTANIPLIGDIEVGQAKQFGEGGGRELASDVLKTASYLFPYGKTAKALTSAIGSKLAGNVASGVVGGYAADVGYNLADENKTVGESMIPGVGTAIGAAIPLVGPVVRGAGRIVSQLGTKAVESAIPVSTREAQILQTYQANNPFPKRVFDILQGAEKAPVTSGKTATTKGLVGTKSMIGTQAKRASKSLWDDVISPRLKQSEYAVDLDGFFSKIEDDIVAKNPELSRQKALTEALDAIKEDYSGIKVITLEQLQKLKEGWAKFVPEKAYRGKPISGAFNDVRNQLADEARQTIYTQLGDDVKQAYFDYGNLQGLQEMGVVAKTGAKLKGGAGSFTSEVLSRAVTPVATVGGQAVYRIGKGIEFIGELGAKNLGEALGIKGLKFPGDKLFDDVQSRFGGQVNNLPTKTQKTQIPARMKKTSIPKTIPPKKSFSNPSVGKTDLTTSIQKAKASGQSFDEWVKVQGETVYHGTNAKIDKFNLDNLGKAQGFDESGIFFTSDKVRAKSFNPDYVAKPKYKMTEAEKLANEKLGVIDAVVDTKQAVSFSEIENLHKKGTITTKPNLDGLTRPEQFFDNNRQLIKELKEKTDIPVIKVTAEGETQYLVLKPEAVKTRSQLKAEWDKVK